MTDTTLFTIPESVFAYFSNSAVQAAVDHLLDNKSAVPVSQIQWAELPEYYRAVLAAHQTKAEYAITLFDLCNTIWGNVIKESLELSKISRLPLKEIQQNGWPKLSIDESWDEFCSAPIILSTADQQITFHINLENINEGPYLLCTIYNIHDEKYVLPPVDQDWKLCEDESPPYIYTRAKLVDVSNPTIDLSMLMLAAKAIVQRIESQLASV